MINQERTGRKLDAKAEAASDCALALRMAPLFGMGSQDREAYRDEVKRISDDLIQGATDADATARAYAELYRD